jgi:phosphate acetyltransferase
MHPKNIYITTTHPRSGTLLASVGMMEMLKGHFKHVAFFRPIIADANRECENITLMIEHFNLDIEYDQCWGVTVLEVIQAFAENKQTQLFDTLMAKVNALYADYDFVLIEGYPSSIFDDYFDFDINIKIAQNLNSACIPVLAADNKSIGQIVDDVILTSELMKEEECLLLATLLNRCKEEEIPALQNALEKININESVYFLPYNPDLNKISLEQINKELNARVLSGNPTEPPRLISSYTIATMGPQNYLSTIKEGDIVIVSGDRSEIILLSLLSYYGSHHPNIAALVLCDNIAPDDNILALIRDFTAVNLPILLATQSSSTCARIIEQSYPHIDASNTRKLTIAKALFERAVDKDALLKRFQTQENEIFTPMMFQYRISEEARKNPQRILLPESEDDRILKAADKLLQRKIAKIILLGKSETILQRSAHLGIDLSEATIIDPEDSVLQEKFTQIFYDLRKEKGISYPEARDTITNINYFATMMLYTKMADGLVSGATHTTADTIRPAFQIIKTRPGIDIVSSIFFMCLDTRVLVYGDCAVNLDPNPEELAQIAIAAAQTAKAFGITPRVAMLSYSTGNSGKGPEVEKVRKATALVREHCPSLPVEGPIQYDAAIDPEVAKIKLPQSKVAGHATVFIFPDLNTGNNTYKAVQRATGALAIGPILQGLQLPVNDLSRGCLVEDIVNTVAITAVQAQKASQLTDKKSLGESI